MRASQEITIQLWTYRQDESILHLIGFPLVHTTSATKEQISVVLWSPGRHKHSVRDPRKALEIAHRTPANGVELTRQLPALSNQATQPRVRAVASRLVVAPTSQVWAPVTGYRLADRVDENSRANHASRERAAKWNGIEQYPSLLQVHIDMERPVAAEDHLDWVAENISPELACLELMGVGDLVTPQLNVLEQLAPWSRAVPLLATHWDDVHSLMIGNAELVGGLADTLGLMPRLKDCACGAPAHRLGLVWLPAEAVDCPAARERAQSWLVSRDQTTASRQADPLLGEFEIQGITFLSARRTRQLAIPLPDPEWVWVHVLEPKYCRALGVDPEDMVVRAMPDQLAMIYRVAVDRQYEAFSNERDEARRIRKAHEQALKEVGMRVFGSSAGPLGTLIQRYFPASRPGARA